ncbi:hypothetical protein B296_00039803, partial [Ensete ventricosum]
GPFTTPRSTLASTFDVQPVSHLVDPPRPIVGHRIRLPHLGQQSVAGDLSPPVACLVVRAHQPVPNTPTPRRATRPPSQSTLPASLPTSPDPRRRVQGPGLALLHVRPLPQHGVIPSAGAHQSTEG